MSSRVRHLFCRIFRFIRARSRVEVLFVALWVLSWIQVGSTKGISPQVRGGARAATVERQVRAPLSDGPATSLRFTSIECLANGVSLAVAWDGGAFASPLFLEFFARTNLVVGTWSSVGWIQAEVGETNLDVVVEADRTWAA